MSHVIFSKELQPLIDALDFSSLGSKVAIKVHFGELGNVTYLDPSLVRAVYDKVNSLGKEATLVECNVLYKGSRTNRTDHLKTAQTHGFGDMNIDILDGEDGQEYVEINGCKVGKGIENYDSLIVFSHFKGHMAAGFGGALKNLGMGLGSRAGKLHMHSAIHPQAGDNCVGCGICVEHCNAGAIAIVDGKAHVDQQACEGCAMCIAVCNNGAMQVPWQGRTAADLQQKISEYAAAIITRFPNALFINALKNITPECDCFGIVQKPVMDDVGFVCSKDIVAADKASLDLANQHSNGAFSKLHHTNNDRQIELAESLGLGSSRYEMQTIG